jgi:hypothetical protein
VLIDGTAVGSFTPAGSTYATFTTSSFTVTAGVHTIAFAGLNPNGGDNTALVDQVAFAAPPPPPPGQLQDPGFETPSVGSGSSAYQYDPTASPWTFVGQAGVSGNGSAFTSGNPNAPQGSQVAFLQLTGSFSQAVTLAAGSYVVSFSAAQRATFQSSSQTFQVRVDGVSVGSFTPSGSTYATLTTSSFTVTAGVHTIAFVGLNPNGGDNTALVDQVVVSAQSQGAVNIVSTIGHKNPGLAHGQGHTIRLDVNTAGWSWFVDPTLNNAPEFTTPGNQGEKHRMDLLTMFAHETGQLLGYEHTHSGVMIDILRIGTRLTPGSASELFDIVVLDRVLGHS